MNTDTQASLRFCKHRKSVRVNNNEPTTSIIIIWLLNDDDDE